jgi:hypothetical protein
MKVSELTGALLDYWVGKADGLSPQLNIKGKYPEREVFGDYVDAGTGCVYQPSSDWSQGGRIIERELGSIIPYEDEKSAEGIWKAGNICKCQLKGMGFVGEGKTILEAAMRAYVGDKFGDEVDDRETHHI